MCVSNLAPNDVINKYQSIPFKYIYSQILFYISKILNCPAETPLWMFMVPALTEADNKMGPLS